MKEVGSYEAKTHLPKLLERVRNGESIRILKNGRAVAILVPAARPRAVEVSDVIRQIKAARKGVTLGNVTVKSLIAEGRR